MSRKLNNKETHIECGFTIMLAVEILRAQLEKFYERKIQFFYYDVTATPISENVRAHKNMSDPEKEPVRSSMKGICFERYVKISAIIGPFWNHVSNRPLEGNRKELRRVEATCRLFTTESRIRYWKPHFLTYVTKNTCGCKLGGHDDSRFEDGHIDGVYGKKNAENPCGNMVISQIPATYQNFHSELYPLEEKDPLETRSTF